MKNSTTIQHMKGIELLNKPGKAIDVGAMHGAESIALAELGYEVSSYDTRIAELEKNISKYDNRDRIKIYEQDITKVAIEEDSCDVIIAKNILPFVYPHGMETLNKLLKALKSDGAFMFTLFGNKHQVAKQDNVWCLSEKEIGEVDDLLEKYGVDIVFRSIKEGLAPTMQKGPYYWHSYEYICQRV